MAFESNIFEAVDGNSPLRANSSALDALSPTIKRANLRASSSCHTQPCQPIVNSSGLPITPFSNNINQSIKSLIRMNLRFR